MASKKVNKDGEGKLNSNQLLFCQYYVSEEYFGNGVKSYCKAYNIDVTDIQKYNNARFKASDLLSLPHISEHINKLLDDAGLNDNFVDKRLLFLMSQNEDKSTSLGAIREYNKLRNRITDRLEIKGDFDITLKLD